MLLECEKSKIESVIQKASRLANKHLTLPVLACIYLEAIEGKLIVRSTNLDLGIEIDLKVKVLKTGVLAVPANVLLGALSSMKDPKIVLESKEGNLKVSSGKNSALIKCLPYEDFPVIPKLNNGNVLKINSHNLISGFKSVWYSASVSNIKPELSSVYVYKEDTGLVFVATDSFRLAEKKINIKITEDFPQILIPFKNVAEIMKLFEDYNGDLNIIFEKNQAAFTADDTYVVSRLIDGNFPDYKQIIPKNFATTAVILKNDIINSIKASNVFSDTLNQVRFKTNIKDKNIKIESKNNDVGEYQDFINTASISGEDVELNFNNKYIMDCMQSITADSLSLSFGGIGKPLVINGATDKSFLYLVMPMNR